MVTLIECNALSRLCGNESLNALVNEGINNLINLEFLNLLNKIPKHTVAFVRICGTGSCNDRFNTFFNWVFITFSVNIGANIGKLFNVNSLIWGAVSVKPVHICWNILVLNKSESIDSTNCGNDDNNATLVNLKRGGGEKEILMLRNYIYKIIHNNLSLINIYTYPYSTILLLEHF